HSMPCRNPLRRRPSQAPPLDHTFRNDPFANIESNGGAPPTRRGSAPAASPDRNERVCAMAMNSTSHANTSCAGKITRALAVLLVLGACAAPAPDVPRTAKAEWRYPLGA